MNYVDLNNLKMSDEIPMPMTPLEIALTAFVLEKYLSADRELTPSKVVLANTYRELLRNSGDQVQQLYWTLIQRSLKGELERVVDDMMHDLQDGPEPDHAA